METGIFNTVDGRKLESVGNKNQDILTSVWRLKHSRYCSIWAFDILKPTRWPAPRPLSTRVRGIIVIYPGREMTGFLFRSKDGTWLRRAGCEKAFAWLFYGREPSLRSGGLGPTLRGGGGGQSAGAQRRALQLVRLESHKSFGVQFLCKSGFQLLFQIQIYPGRKRLPERKFIGAPCRGVLDLAKPRLQLKWKIKPFCSTRRFLWLQCFSL